MTFTKYLLGLCACCMLALVSPVHAQTEGVAAPAPVQEEEAPAEGITYSDDLEKATKISSTIIGRILEGDLATVPADIDFLETFLADSQMTDEQKQSANEYVDVMRAFFATENSVVTPTVFLLASNDLYKEINNYRYAVSEPAQPAYMYQLRHLARKLQFQALEANWKAIEEHTSEEVVDLVSDIYRNLEDPEVWQEAIRPLNKQLLDGVDMQDLTMVYGAAQGYLSAAPLIETATIRKAVEEEKQAEAESASKNRIFIGGILIMLVIAGAYFLLRRRKT